MQSSSLVNRSSWRKRWLRRRGDVGALAIIIGFFVCFFSWLLLERKFSIGSDSFNYSFPMRTVAWQMLRNGTIPLWTPHILSGYPLLPMEQLALGYPLTWGYLFLPNVWAEQIYLLAPFILGPSFTYAYARVLKRSRTGSVLAGLVFGYGGIMVGVLALYGFTSNSIIWLPLLLIAVERSRLGRFVPCLLGGTASYAMSLLSGYPQGSAYVAVIVVAYAAFVSLCSPPAQREPSSNKWLHWARWRPLAVALGSFALAFGIAAFQLLETMRALRRSTRTLLEQELFHGRTDQLFNYLVVSLLAPVYHWEIPTYVAPLAILLAVMAIARGIRRGQRDAQVMFWFAFAVVVWLLLSAITPITELFNRLPVFRSFQNPLRHSFEWAFAVAILSAYGWDHLQERARERWQQTSTEQKTRLITAGALLLLSLVVAVLWWLQAAKSPPAPPTIVKLLRSPYMLWKTGFTILVLAIVYLGQQISTVQARRVILLSIVVLACFVEAHITVWQWWRPFAKPPARYATPGAATQFLTQFPSEANRVYTRVNRFVEELPLAPRLDPQNVTALYNLQNVAGAEPLLLDRYSRALGGVLDDTVSPRYGSKPNLGLFGPRSHVLDLLNTSFVVSYADLVTAPEFLIVKDDIKFGRTLDLELLPGQSGTLAGVQASGDTLSIVSVLSGASDVQQDSEVARVRVFTTDGQTLERSLRAGVDTAEWAHDRQDVLPLVRHKLAPIFEDRRGDPAGSFIAHNYITRLPLGAPVKVDRVEITNVSPKASLDLVAVTLFDSIKHFSTPLPNLDPARWQAVYNRDDVLILRNKRALPRVWLVGDAEAVDGEEALRRITGESEHEFDPRRTALLEVDQRELPPLPGGAIGPESDAHIVRYEPTHLLIETRAPTNTIMVVSEIFYPGWEAIVDGRPTPIKVADFLLRGVALSSGHHIVEMRYTAPAARNGALIGLFSVVLMCGLAIYDLRKRGSN